jgi:hypothetical protein
MISTGLTRSPPIGPINSGDTISLVVLSNNLYYVATYDPVLDDILFLWYFTNLGAVNTTLNKDTIMQFRVTGNYNHLVLDVTNTKASGRRVLSKALGTAQIMSVLRPSSTDESIGIVTEYSMPPPPGVLFASIGYAPIIAGTSTTISIRGQQQGVGMQFIANADIYPVPTTFFLRRDGDATTFTCTTGMTDPALGVRTFICGSCTEPYCGGVQYCSTPTVLNAWTRITDCQVDNNYVYCKKGQVCGSCYGQCGGTHQECRHATGSKFVCSSQAPVINSELIALNKSGPLQPFLPGTGSNEDDLFIVPYNYRKTTDGSDTIAIVVICIVVLIIIAGIIYYISQSRSTPPPNNNGYRYRQPQAYGMY